MSCLLISVLIVAANVAVPQHAVVPDDAKAAIAAANYAWLPALQSHDAAAIAAPYADDGIFVTATGAVVKGREGVAQLMKERFAQMGKVS